MSSYQQEIEPLTSMKMLLENNWLNYGEIPSPVVLVANLPSEPFARFDLNESDYIILRADSPERIEYRGNFKYFDRIYIIIVTVWSKESRQRIKDMYKIIRTIIFSKMHDFSDYQLMRTQDYREFMDKELNVWHAEISIRLESHGLSAETL